MIKKLKVPPFPKEIVVPKPDDLKGISYYGGKLRDASWVISQFPPHDVYVEVFGGGGAVIFNKKPAPVNDVYNDRGNVAVFWKVVQTWPDELYQKLYWTPYSRQEFEECCNTWEAYAEKSRETGAKEDYIEFARRWFIQVSISYSHREDDKSFKVAVQVNNSNGLRRHTDLLPYLGERLRSICVEHLDFRRVFDLYDRPNVLFYCDPPYTSDSRVSNGTYRCEMSLQDQNDLMKLINNCQGQVVLSGYDNPLYEEHLRGWRIVRKTVPSAIQNRAQLDGRGDRTEVLWIREREYGLWSYASDIEQTAPSNVATIQDQGQELPYPILLSE